MVLRDGGNFSRYIVEGSRRERGGVLGGCI